MWPPLAGTLTLNYENQALCKMKKPPGWRTGLPFLSLCLQPCILSQQPSPRGLPSPHCFCQRGWQAFQENAKQSGSCQASKDRRTLYWRKMYLDFSGEGKQPSFPPNPQVSCPCSHPASPKLPWAAGPNSFPIFLNISKSPWPPRPPAETATAFLTLSPQVAFSLHFAEKIDN